MANNKDWQSLGITLVTTVGGVVSGLWYGREALKDLYLEDQKTVSKRVSSAVKAFEQEQEQEKLEKSATISLVEVEDVAEYEEVEMSEDQKSAWRNSWSILLSDSIKSSVSAIGSRGLLKCDLPIDTLVRNKQNPEFLRGWTMTDGRISQQANFKEVGTLGAAQVTQLTMMCLSVVTSQYYMHQINESLASINDKLDYLCRYNDEERVSKVQTAFKNVMDIRLKASWDEFDFNFVRERRYEIEQVRNHYRRLVHAAKVNTSWKFGLGDQVDDMLKSLNESHYLKNLQIAYEADRRLFFTTICAIHIAQTLGRQDDALMMFRDLEVGLWGFYGEQFTRMKNQVIEFIKCKRDHALFSSREKIRGKLRQCTSEFSKLENEIRTFDQNHSPRVTEYIGYNQSNEIARFRRRIMPSFGEKPIG